MATMKFKKASTILNVFDEYTPAEGTEQQWNKSKEIAKTHGIPFIEDGILQARNGNTMLPQVKAARVNVGAKSAHGKKTEKEESEARLKSAITSFSKLTAAEAKAFLKLNGLKVA